MKALLHKPIFIAIILGIACWSLYQNVVIPLQARGRYTAAFNDSLPDINESAVGSVVDEHRYNLGWSNTVSMFNPFHGELFVSPTKTVKKQRRHLHIKQLKPLQYRYTLLGILSGNEKPLALINKKVVAENDSIGHAKVIHIDSDYVLLSEKKKKIKLRLPKH